MDVTAPLGSYLTPSFDHATVGDAMRPWVLHAGWPSTVQRTPSWLRRAARTASCVADL